MLSSVVLIVLSGVEWCGGGAGQGVAGSRRTTAAHHSTTAGQSVSSQHAAFVSFSLVQSHARVLPFTLDGSLRDTPSITTGGYLCRLGNHPGARLAACTAPRYLLTRVQNPMRSMKCLMFGTR